MKKMHVCSECRRHVHGICPFCQPTRTRFGPRGAALLSVLAAGCGPADGANDPASGHEAVEPVEVTSDEAAEVESEPEPEPESVPVPAYGGFPREAIEPEESAGPPPAPAYGLPPNRGE